MALKSALVKGILQVKAGAEAIPGAHKVYKWVTSRTGEGRVYTIARGPMAGILWRRRNCLPIWYHMGVYEPQTSRFLAAHLRPGDVFWDLGANAGYHTLMGARAVGAGGRVVAIEPDPETCEILRDQLAINRIDNCTVVQAAVSDRIGTIRLVQRASDLRGNALEEIDSPAIDNKVGKVVEVPTLTLDDLAARHPRPRFIKIDIEGAEVLALPGGRALLSAADRPERLLIAVHGEEADAFCRGFMRDLGYELEPSPELSADTLVFVARERR